MAWPRAAGTRRMPRTRPVVTAPQPMSRPSTVPSPTCFSSAGDAFEIAELGQAGLDGHAQRRAGLDRVETEIVAQVVEPGDLVQVAPGRGSSPAGRSSRTGACRRWACPLRPHRGCGRRSHSPACSACPILPPRARITSRMCSPRRLAASSKLPVLKLRVGSDPISLTAAVMDAVPYRCVPPLGPSLGSLISSWANAWPPSGRARRRPAGPTWLPPCQ